MVFPQSPPFYALSFDVSKNLRDLSEIEPVSFAKIRVLLSIKVEVEKEGSRFSINR